VVCGAIARRQDVPFQSRAAYIRNHLDGHSKARNELRVTQDVGLPARWITETELPIPVLGAVEMAGRLQIDPPMCSPK
jgi:hypothetical protein